QRGEIAHDRMIRMMIGRDLRSLYLPPKRPPGVARLEIAGMSTPAHDQPIDLSLRSGEILGMAGLVGAGRSELALSVFGIDRPQAGELRLDGRVISVRSPRDAIANGIFLVPEDRKRSGLVLESSVTENITLANLVSFASAMLVSRSAERDCA